MIYRITVDTTYAFPTPHTRLTGANQFGLLMRACGLPVPAITNQRARFWFTEAGWRACGRHVARAATREGHLVRVERRKQPRRSRLLYRDHLQVALLPCTEDAR